MSDAMKYEAKQTEDKERGFYRCRKRIKIFDMTRELKME